MSPRFQCPMLRKSESLNESNRRRRRKVTSYPNRTRRLTAHLHLDLSGGVALAWFTFSGESL